MPPRLNPDLLRGREALRRRIAQLLQERWQGNQVRMAADMGVSQSLVSKIVRGVQGAGRQFLARLEAQPGIRAEWLLHGEGEPFVMPLAGTLPVADRVLPGPPNAHAILLTGDRHPVAMAFDSGSRYWLRLSATEPLLTVDALELRTGDHLLLETDTSWTHRADLLPGRICGLRRSSGGAATYQAALVRRSAEGSWSIEPAFRDPSNTPVTLPPGSRFARRPQRNIYIPHKREEIVRQPEKAKGTSRGQVAPAGPQVVLEDIVAVCLYIARSNPVYL